MVNPRIPAPPLREPLTDDELRRILLPLRADYRSAAIRTADLNYADRKAAMVERLERYSDALSWALAGGVDDATLLVCGPRAVGGRR
jgi:hypothetical protein